MNNGCSDLSISGTTVFGMEPCRPKMYDNVLYRVLSATFSLSAAVTKLQLNLGKRRSVPCRRSAETG
jgi:hypothetical protein